MGSTNRGWSCALGLVGLCGLAGPALADGGYYCFKELHWILDKDKTGVVAGPNSGTYRYQLHSLVDDVDTNDLKDVSSNKGDAVLALNEKLVKSGTVANDKPVGYQEPPRPITKNFDQTTGGNPLWVDNLASAGTYGNANATGKLIVEAPQVDAAGNARKVKSTMEISGSATTKPPKKDTTVYSESGAYLDLELKAKIDHGSWKKDNGGGKGSSGQILSGGSRKHVEGGATGGANQGPAWAKDPIVLTFRYESTGELFASSVLYEDYLQATGDASVDWGDGGLITIRAALGAEAMISIATPSEWITNPFSAIAGIDAAGQFYVTGDLAGLPWQLDSGPGGLTASLPMSAIGHDFSFDYDAHGAGDPTSDLIAELNSDVGGYVPGYKTEVPAPGSLAVVVGVLMLSPARRRGGV